MLTVLLDSRCLVSSGDLFFCIVPGFTVTGSVSPEAILRKSGLSPGQALILTKPLGTGVLMAGAMKGLGAKGKDIIGALQVMQQSSGTAVQVLQQYGCTAATDVTGFGLLGHALEMAKASQVSMGRVRLVKLQMVKEEIVAAD